MEKGSAFEFPEISKNPVKITEEKVFLNQEELHHGLTDYVRDKYLKYTRKILRQNYERWLYSDDNNATGGLKVTDDEIDKTARKLELEAVKACMVVSLYRKAIIEIIENIKNETKQNNLDTTLIHIKFNSKPPSKNMTTQTEFEMFSNTNVKVKRKRSERKSSNSADMLVSSTSLDEKIRKFQESMSNAMTPPGDLPIVPPKTPTIKMISHNNDSFYQIPGLESWNVPMSPFITTPTRPPATPTIKNSDLMPEHRSISMTPNPHMLNDSLIDYPSVSNAPTPNSHILDDSHSQYLPQIPATPTCLLTPASTCTSFSLQSSNAQDDIDAKIMQELQEMFGTGDDNLVENIFDDGYNPELEKVIIHEIQSYDETKVKQKVIDNQTTKPVSANPNPIVHQGVDCRNNNSPSIDLGTLSEMIDPEQKEREIKEQLKQSLWPCELYHQKMRLRNILSEIAEKNFRKYEKIIIRFRELFDDDDSENELAPYSPTIELDDILIASCRKRISNWVVRGLMRPMKEGLIANRYLFKKLAKHIAEGIILLDQYPDETLVKDYINEYFCRHRAIQNLDDIY